MTHALRKVGTSVATILDRLGIFWCELGRDAVGGLGRQVLGSLRRFAFTGHLAAPIVWRFSRRRYRWTRDLELSDPIQKLQPSHSSVIKNDIWYWQPLRHELNRFLFSNCELSNLKKLLPDLFSDLDGLLDHFGQKEERE
jgi:hypothetical protein